MAPGPRDPPLAAERLFTNRRQSAASLEYHLVRPAGPAACLRRRHQTNRSAFDRIDPGLAAQASLIGLAFRLAPISPDTLSRAAIRADPVKGWLVASRYSLRPRSRLAARPTTSRKDASHRFLQPTFTLRAPLRILRFPGFASRAPLRARFVTTPDFAWWRGLDPGGASLDGDPPASVAVMTLRGLVNAVSWASCLAWRWRRPVLAGAAIDSPSERRRPTAVLSTASRARDSTSDARCRAQLLPRSMPGFHWEPDPIPPSSRQSRRFLRIRAPSIDECSVAGARHRSHGFAAARRLPEPVRSWCPRFPRWAQRLDPMRLRVGQAPFVDFCNQIDPRARAANPPIPGCGSHGRPRGHAPGGVAPMLPPGPKIRSEST
jgi:hypothetical protein